MSYPGHSLGVSIPLCIFYSPSQLVIAFFEWPKRFKEKYGGSEIWLQEWEAFKKYDWGQYLVVKSGCVWQLTSSRPKKVRQWIMFFDVRGIVSSVFLPQAQTIQKGDLVAYALLGAWLLHRNNGITSLFIWSCFVWLFFFPQVQDHHLRVLFWRCGDHQEGCNNEAEGIPEEPFQ